MLNSTNDNDRPSPIRGAVLRTIIMTNGQGGEAAILAAAAPAIPWCCTALTNTGRIEDELANFEVLPSACRSLLALRSVWDSRASHSWRTLIPQPHTPWYLQPPIRAALYAAGRVTLTATPAHLPGLANIVAKLGFVPVLPPSGPPRSADGQDFMTDAFSRALVVLARAEQRSSVIDAKAEPASVGD